MARREKQSANNSDWNEYRKVDSKRNKNKQKTRNTRKQKLTEKRNFLS